MTKIIGVTGGIASGKSTVVAEIRKAGYEVIDADSVVHELQAKGGKLYQALIFAFGTGILNAAGELDRPKLSQLIFSSPENREKSAKLQNKIIRQELATRRDQLAQSQEIFFMDIPLLIELDYVDWFDQIWLVAVDKETQIKRLMARNAYSKAEAELRIAAQMPLEEKKTQATLVLDNNGTLTELVEQVSQALTDLTAQK